MFFGGILYRVILWELIRVFLLCLTGLTGLFVIVGLVKQAADAGLGLGQIARIVPLIVPYSLPYTIPATTLFACCIVYGRISHDNESVVLKAAGVDLLTLLSPAVTLGIMSTVATAAIAHSYIPEKQRQLQEELLRDPEEMVFSLLKRERRIREESIPWELYFDQVRVTYRKTPSGELEKERWLLNVVAKLRAPDSTPGEPKYQQIGRTREARLMVDMDRKKTYVEPNLTPSEQKEMEEAIAQLTAKDPVRRAAAEKKVEDWVGVEAVGRVRELAADLADFDIVKKEAARSEFEQLVKDARRQKAEKERGPVVIFDSKTWVTEGPKLSGQTELRDPPTFDLPDRFRKEKLFDSDFKSRSPVIDWPDLPRWAAYWHGSANEQRARGDRLKTDPNFEPLTPPEERARQIRHCDETARFFDRTGRTLTLEYHMRPALAFGCICFAIIGCPVGLWANRADYLSTFVICFLPTIVTYYPLLLSGGGLARDGSVPMVVGVWGPNFIALIAALLLVHKLIKR